MVYFSSFKISVSSASYESSYGTINMPNPPRRTVTPRTVGTTYSPLKQSTIALSDDVDADEIGVALIEHDALDNAMDTASTAETFEHIQFQNLFEQVKVNCVNIFEGSRLFQKWSVQNLEHQE